MGHDAHRLSVKVWLMAGQLQQRQPPDGQAQNRRIDVLVDNHASGAGAAAAKAR